MTALGNWWTVSNGSSSFATHSNVLGLIGCIGVTLAALVQLPLLPQFLGGTMPAIARYGIRAALCAPALVAIVIAIVTTLGGPDAHKLSTVGVTLLSMGVGFALVGLDDGHEALPPGTLRWCAVGIAALGAVLNVLSIIQVLSFSDDNSWDDGSELTAKIKWLFAIPSLLFLVCLAGLIIWAALKRLDFGAGLLTALAYGVGLSLLTHGWMESNTDLLSITALRNGHGAPLIALALTLATAASVSGNPADTATDPGSSARRLTSWVVQGYGLAAIAALVTALAFCSAIGDDGAGAPTWYAVLMFITTLAYGACAFLLRTNPMGRIIALGATAVVTLTVLITFAAATKTASFNDSFSEGAYLWLPVLAACALTLPPSVRAVAGPVLPKRQTPAQPQYADQQFGAPGQQGPQA